MESLTVRQAAVVASAKKTVYWLFRVTDNQSTPVTYYWSTGEVSSFIDSSINVGAQETPGSYAGSEWEYPHEFRIINFSGVTLRRNKSESGIHAPNDVSFSIINPTVGGVPTYTSSNFKGGVVRIALVIDDGLGKQIVGSWRFVIKSASAYNQQIDITGEDFLQEKLRGTYPNTRLVSDIFKANTDNTIIKDNMVVPEVYGTAYIPLRSICAADGYRYYLLGPSTGKTYSISEVREPRAIGKVKWTAAAGPDGPYDMTQSTKIADDLTSWRVFQPIVAISHPDAIPRVADASYVRANGDTFYDLPTRFSELSTVNMTSPADVIKRVLLNMGKNISNPSESLADSDIDVDAAREIYKTWTTVDSPNGLEWNFAFWYQEERVAVLSRLLAMCHSCLIVGEKIKLQVLSAVPVKTITSTEVTKSQEDGPSSFKYTDALQERLSDSGYMSWQQAGESQDQFLKYLVPAHSDIKDYPDSVTVEIAAVQDSVQAQKLTSLYLQRLLLKVADISADLKGTCLAIRPDDVIRINYVDFGGDYKALVDEITINSDCSVSIRGLVFSESLDDWAGVTPSAITIAVDNTTGAYTVITVGPDSPGATNMPNALPGALRIGSTQNYIRLDPSDPIRISIHEQLLLNISEIERMRFGNLNGYPINGTSLGYVTDAYGIAIGELGQSLTYDKDNGLRISGAVSAGTISIGTTPNWFRVDATGNMWLGAALLADAPFSVTPAGAMKAQSGTVGGWNIGASSLSSPVVSPVISLDSANSKISVVDGSAQERALLGKIETGVYGIQGKDSTGKVIFELRSDMDTPYLDTYADAQAIELELMKMNFQAISWAQFAIFDAFDDETKRASPDPSTFDARVLKSHIDNGDDATADRSFGFVSKTYTSITTIETGTSSSVGSGWLVDSSKTWFTDQCKNLTLVDSDGTTFTVTSNTSNTLTVVGTPTAGVYALVDDDPTAVVAFASYLDSTNGGTGYVKLEASFNGGTNYQVFLDTENSIDLLQGTIDVANTGHDYIARITLKNDAGGGGSILYKFLICTDPSPWRF